jgi:hypothetical protein
MPPNAKREKFIKEISYDDPTPLPPPYKGQFRLDYADLSTNPDGGLSWQQQVHRDSEENWPFYGTSTTFNKDEFEAKIAAIEAEKQQKRLRVAEAAGRQATQRSQDEEQKGAGGLDQPKEVTFA